ncbi:predicted protein [Naegleria gruberi]|uniref:Predicted protein n=1 Tax=Naegleria gruberi TaxID=5762 RepID=D2VB11_NAEGR|nr:uncharacterized protein NAEGRDRAFT_66049 [Naegleria gruberi]EFC46040.1 predicted protein [Naegleria gruberi]|eukprot:XP_002678784.1 predicted protein [Naegleria gruberi strain NEG-M]
MNYLLQGFSEKSSSTNQSIMKNKSRKGWSNALFLLNYFIIMMIILQISTNYYCLAIPNDKNKTPTCKNGRLITNTTTPQQFASTKCSCFKGYSGSDCNIPVCFGLKASSKSVCGGKGNSKCIAPDTCIKINEATIMKRFQSNAKEDSSCSNRGQMSNGQCICSEGFYGESCEYSNCYDTASQLTCSGRGECSSDNICTCRENDMFGDRCQYTLPDKIYQNDVCGSCIIVAGVSGDAIPSKYSLLNNPTGLFVDETTGFIFFADQGNAKARVLTRDDTIYSIASVSTPTSIAFDKKTRDVYIGTRNGLFKLNSKRELSKLNSLYCSSVIVNGQGHVVFTQGPYNKISKLVNGVQVEVAGDNDGEGKYDGDNKVATDAKKNYPRIALFKTNSSKIIYLAGQYEQGYDPIVISDNVLATTTSVNHPRSLYVKNGELYFADTYNSLVRKITLSTGVLSTIAGNGGERFYGDGGLGTSASLNYPYGIHLHTDGSIYIADTYNSKIRKLDSSKKISSVAGNGYLGYSDNTQPLRASFNLAVSVLINNVGDMYISDYANNVIRKMSSSGAITTIAGQAKISGFADSLNAKTALLNGPFGLYYQESTQTLFFADSLNGRIRKLTKNGAIETVLASINDPREISFHTTHGHMYFTSGGDQTIKVLFSNGTLSVLNIPKDYYIGLHVDSTNDYLYASGYTYIYRFSIAGGSSIDHNQTDPIIDNISKNCTKGCEKGECVNGTCVCKENYGGEICDRPMCFGKLSNESGVCNTHGVCLQPNVCYCYGNWEAEECTQCKSGFTGSNCRTCADGFVGELCNIPICFNVFANESNVCSGHGSCKSPNNCSCFGNWEGESCQSCKEGYTGSECDTPVSGYSGSNCDIPVCFGSSVEGDGSLVCSGHGNCSGPDMCTCNENWSGNDCSTCREGYYGEDCSSCTPGFSGERCDIPSCFGISANASNVCSGNGYCFSPDLCSCFENWKGESCNQCSSDYIGELCDIPSCFGVNGNDRSVCSGHGSCITPSNCSCFNNWEGAMCENCPTGFSGDDCKSCDESHTGEGCDVPICYGLAANNESVCSGNGKCIESSVCVCSGFWTGANCDTCPEKYSGSACDVPVCYGVSANDSMVCSGHGSCVAPSQCFCEGRWAGELCDSCVAGYNGSNCENPICFGEFNTSIVCSGHGLCSALDVCVCSEQWAGETCGKCNSGYYGITCELSCDPQIVKPSLTIKQGSIISYVIGTSIALEPELTIPLCYAGHFSSISYGYASDFFNQSQLVQVDKFLVIGESTKSSGTLISNEGEYSFKVIATLGRLEISTSFEFIVKSNLASLTLDFNIPNMLTQSFEKPLEFEVKASDPSFPSDLTEGDLSLNCWNQDNQLVEKLVDTVFNHTITVSKQLNPGQYVCEATFKKDSRVITKSIQVVLVDVSSSNVLTVTLKLEGQNPTWVNPTKDLTISADIKESIGPNVVYDWKSPFQPMDTTVSNQLVIPSSQLALGKRYNISLIVTDGSKKGFGFISFKTYSPPSMGSFSVSPLFGYSLTTNFMLSGGVDWISFNQDVLTFTFIYRSVGSLAWKSLAESSVQTSLNTTLPSGTWETSVSVSDSFLSYTIYDKPVIVQVNTTDLTVAQLNYVASNPITPSVISSLISYVSSGSSSNIKTSLTKETLDTTLTVSSLKSAISVIDSVSSVVNVFRDSESTVVLEYFSTVLHKTISNGIQMSSDDIQLCLNSATKFEEFFFGSKRRTSRAVSDSLEKITQIYNILTEVQFRKLKEGEGPSRISSLSYYSYCKFMKSDSIAPYSDTITQTSLQFSLLQALNTSRDTLGVPENSMVCLKMYYVQSWRSVMPSSYTVELSFLDIKRDYASVSISSSHNIAKLTIPRMNTGVDKKQTCYLVDTMKKEECSISSTSPLQIVIQTTKTGKFFVGYYEDAATPIVNPSNGDVSLSAFIVIFAIILPILVCGCICAALAIVCGCACKKWKARAALNSHSILRSTQSLPLPNERLDVTFDDINVYNTGINSSPLLPLYIQPSELKLLSKLGSGGYGSVHKAYWKDQLVAVKSTPVPDNSKQIEIPREAALMYSLKHPNIVECYGISIKGKEQLIVMEYVNGNLNQLIGDLCRKSIKMDLDEKIEILLQIATGMNYLHQLNPSIVHRDLTPANVLFDPRTKACKICDFGLSKPLNLENTETKNRSTIYFVPNELICCTDPNLTNNPRAIDVYSFSILAWQVIFEDHPYLYINKEKLFSNSKFKHTPYVDVTNDNLLARVATGLRPVIPFNADTVSKWTQKFIKSKYDNDLIALSMIAIAQLVQNCWNLNPHLRPNFQDVSDTLQTCKNTLSSNHPLLV